MNHKPVGQAAARRAHPPRQGARRRRGARARLPAGGRDASTIAGGKQEQRSLRAARPTPALARRAAATPRAARRRRRPSPRRHGRTGPGAVGDAHGVAAARTASWSTRRPLFWVTAGAAVAALAFGTIEAFNAAGKRDAFNNHTSNVGGVHVPGLRHRPACRPPASRSRTAYDRAFTLSVVGFVAAGALAAGASALLLLSSSESRRRVGAAASARAFGCVPDPVARGLDLQPSLLNRRRSHAQTLVLVCALLGGSGFGCGLRVQPLSPTAASARRRAGIGSAAGTAAAVAPAAGGGGGGRVGGGGGTGGAADGGGTDDGPPCTAGLGLHAGATAATSDRRPAGRAAHHLHGHPAAAGERHRLRSGAWSATTAAAPPAPPAAACTVTGKPCRTGTIACTTGAPVCTEIGQSPNGTSCGTGMVCQAGAVHRLSGGRRLHARPTPATRGRSPARRGPRSAPTRGRSSPRARPAARTRSAARPAPAATARWARAAPSPASPAGPARPPATPARRSAWSRGTSPTAPAAGRTWSAARASAWPARRGSPARRPTPATPGSRPARRPSPARTAAANLVNGTVCGTNKVCNNGSCDSLHGRRELPADQPLPDRRDLVRDRHVGLRRDRKPAERHQLRDEHGLQQRRLRRLHGRRRLRADQPLPQRDADLHDRQRRSAPTAAPRWPTGRAAARTWSARRGAASPAPPASTCTPSNPCKNGSDVVRDRDLGLRDHQQQAGRHAVRRRAVVHGRRQDLGRDVQRERGVRHHDDHLPERLQHRGDGLQRLPRGRDDVHERVQEPQQRSRPTAGRCGHVCADPPVVGSGSATCSGGTAASSCNAGYLAVQRHHATARSRAGASRTASTDGFAIVGNDQMAVTSISVVDLGEPRRDVRARDRDRRQGSGARLRGRPQDCAAAAATSRRAGGP